MSSIQGLPQSNPKVAIESVAGRAVFALTAPILGMTLNPSGAQQNGRDVCTAAGRAEAGGQESAAVGLLKGQEGPKHAENTLILLNDDE